MRERGSNVIHGRDNVRPRLAENDDENSGFAASQSDNTRVLDLVLHIGNITESNWRTVLVSDYEISILIRAKNLVIRMDGPGIHCPREFSFRSIGGRGFGRDAPNGLPRLPTR